MSCSRESNSKKIKYNFVGNSTSKRSDSLKIKIQLDSLLLNKEQFFYSYTGEYFDTSKTYLFIDTILFDSSMSKCVLLIQVSAKNLKFSSMTAKKLESINPKITFDGFCIIGKKNNSLWSLQDMKYHIGNYDSREECKIRLSEIYFEELNGKFAEPNYCMFTIDDRRFWKEPIWGTF